MSDTIKTPGQAPTPNGLDGLDKKPDSVYPDTVIPTQHEPATVSREIPIVAKKSSKKWLTAAGIMTATTATVVGFALGQNNTSNSNNETSTNVVDKPTDNNLETSAPVKSTPTPSSLPNSTELVNEYPWLIEVGEIPAGAIQEASDLSPGEFEALSNDGRLVYTSWLLGKTAEYPDYFAPELLQSNPNDAARIDNTAEEILNQVAFIHQAAAQQLEQITTDTSVTRTLERNNSQKILSALYRYMGENSTTAQYRNDVAAITSLPEPTLFSYDSYNTSAVDASEVLSGVSREGETVQYKVLTIEDLNGNRLDWTMVYHEYTGVDAAGTAKNYAIWQIADIAQLDANPQL